MSSDRIDPPKHSMWAQEVQKWNAKIDTSGARAFTADRQAARTRYRMAKELECAADTPEKVAEAKATVAKAKADLRCALPRPIPHPGVRRADLWQTLLDVLNTLEGEAATRLANALRDQVQSEELVLTLQDWEIFDGDPLAVYRAHHSIAEGRAVRTRLQDVLKELDRLPDDYMAALPPSLIAAALELEDRENAPRADELSEAAWKAARALADLRALVVRAESVAPKAKARPHAPSKSARLRLAAGLCRALGKETDAAFWDVFKAVWKALVGDDPDKPDPPDMQATREYLRDLRRRGDL